MSRAKKGTSKASKAPASDRAGKRDRNKEKTKEQILSAALQLFREKGIEGTTTKEISKKAGIAEGTLFNYFETKEDLALYFFEESLTEMIEWYQNDRGMKRAALPEKLFGIIEHLLDSLAPYEEFIGAVYLRGLVASSKLSPFSLQSQER